jgi:hypothetical protein
VPVEPAAAPEGERVRIILTREGVLDLPELPQGGGPMVSGLIARKSDDQVYLRIPVVVRQEGFLQSTLGQDIAVPFAQIVQLERRQLSRSRTGMMVAGTVGVAAAIVFKIVDGSFGGEPPVPSGGDDLRLPAF